MARKPLRWNIAQKVELAWWKRYLGSREKASYLKWKEDYWNDLIGKLGPDSKAAPGSRVMDAGCGPAGIFMIMEDCRVHAIDPLLDMYQRDIPHFEAAAYPWVKFENNPLEKLNQQGVFDVIYCMNAINHVSDLDLCCDNLCNSLKSGGRFIVSIDAHNHQFFKHLFRAIPGDVLHPHQYDLNEYRQMFEKRGIRFDQQLRLKSEFFFDHYVLSGCKVD